eukprot:sb/3474736/
MSQLFRHFLRISGPALACQISRPLCTAALRKMPVLTKSSPMDAHRRTGASWTADQIQERIFFVMNQYDKIDGSKVHLDASLVDDLGLDSLDIVELCYHVERSMDTWISDDERETVETVRDIWEICMHKLLYRFA